MVGVSLFVVVAAVVVLAVAIGLIAFAAHRDRGE